MAAINVHRVSHSYMESPRGPGDFALKEVSLNFADGGAYALLGPSGCGKSTLLKAISGLLRPTTGEIVISDQDVTTLTARDRQIAQVFQFPVVYETMSVAQNLAFPLKNRGLDSDEIRSRVEEVAALLGLTKRLHRPAVSLPADARQLVSLGRGLVRTDINAILLDEPLTVIDPEERWQLRKKLKALHLRCRNTMLYVTHDQTEAMSFADQIVVMRDGEVLQTGAPGDLFERPQHAFVGRFVGSPGMNFVACEWDGQNINIGDYALPYRRSSGAEAQPQSDYLLGIRPEHVHLSSADGLPARLLRTERTSRRQLLYFEHASGSICASLPVAEPVPPASHRLAFDPAHVGLFADEIRVDAA